MKHLNLNSVIKLISLSTILFLSIIVLVDTLQNGSNLL